LIAEKALDNRLRMIEKELSTRSDAHGKPGARVRELEYPNNET